MEMHLFLRIHVQCHLHSQLPGTPLNSSKLNQMYITLNKLLEEFFCTQLKQTQKTPHWAVIAEFNRSQ